MKTSLTNTLNQNLDLFLTSLSTWQLTQLELVLQQYSASSPEEQLEFTQTTSQKETQLLLFPLLYSMPNSSVEESH